MHFDLWELYAISINTVYNENCCWFKTGCIRFKIFPVNSNFTPISAGIDLFVLSATFIRLNMINIFAYNEIRPAESQPEVRAPVKNVQICVFRKRNSIRQNFLLYYRRNFACTVTLLTAEGGNSCNVLKMRRFFIIFFEVQKLTNLLEIMFSISFNI